MAKRTYNCEKCGTLIETEDTIYTITYLSRTIGGKSYQVLLNTETNQYEAFYTDEQTKFSKKKDFNEEKEAKDYVQNLWDEYVLSLLEVKG